MLPKVVEMVKETAQNLRQAVQRCILARWTEANNDVAGSFVNHLCDTIDIVYGEQSQESMRPIRLGIASILDAAIFWMIVQPSFYELITSDVWRRHEEAIASDAHEMRRLLSSPCLSFDDDACSHRLQQDAIDILLGRRWSGETLPGDLETYAPHGLAWSYTGTDEQRRDTRTPSYHTARESKPANDE